MVNKQRKLVIFLKTKQRSQATTIENLRPETSWQIHTILIEGTECISQLFVYQRLGVGKKNSIDGNCLNFGLFSDGSMCSMVEILKLLLFEFWCKHLKLSKQIADF